MKTKVLFVALLLALIMSLFSMNLTQAAHAATASQKTQLIQSSALKSATYSVGCSFGTPYQVWIQHSDGSAVCYGGSGYLGVYIQNVVYINPNGTWGWYRYYDSSGGHWLNDDQGTGYWFNGPVLVTQICSFCSPHP